MYADDTGGLLRWVCYAYHVMTVPKLGLQVSDCVSASQFHGSTFPPCPRGLLVCRYLIVFHGQIKVLLE